MICKNDDFNCSPENFCLILQKLPEVNDQKIVECESTKNALIPFQKNQDKSSTDKTDPNNTDVLTNGNLSHKKKKYKKRHISDETEVRPKKKARTVKILLEEKRVVESKYIYFYFFCKCYRTIHVGDFTAETLLLKRQLTRHFTYMSFNIPCCFSSIRRRSFRVALLRLILCYAMYYIRRR